MLTANTVNVAGNASVLGNFGVGTAAPLAKLHVEGGSMLVNSAGTGVILKSPDGLTCRVALASQRRLNVPLSNGAFTVRLDFGAPAFDGGNRRAEVGVRRIGRDALGFYHEHQRSDRDVYVAIFCSNVMGGCQGTIFNTNFPVEGTAKIYGAYDFDSVLHYDQCAICPKRYQLSDRLVSVVDEITDLDFIADPL